MARKSFESSVTDFTQAVGLLVRRVRAAASSSELSWTENSVLARLSQSGPMTIADLARAESVKPQSMGTVVAALEESRLVKRSPHPTDGRQVQIELTPEGEALRKATREAKRGWLSQAIAELGEQDRETLFAAGEIMRRLTESDKR